MQEFVHRKNLEHYRKLLTETTDETMRTRLIQLLADEKAAYPQTRREWAVC